MNKLRKTLFLTGMVLAVSARAQEGSWEVTTTDYAAPHYYAAAMANGQLGILPGREPFSVEEVTVNHVFEYADEEEVGCNRVIEAPVPFGLSMRLNGRKKWKVEDWSQTVDFRRAEHRTSFTAGGKVRIGYTFTALRNLPNCLLMEVEAEALEDCTLSFENRQKVPASCKEVDRRFQDFETSDDTPVRLQRVDATTEYGRYGLSMATLFKALDKEPALKGNARRMRFTYRLRKGERVSFLLSGTIATSLTYSDYRGEAQREAVYVQMNDIRRLKAQHRALWDDLWQGDIEIEGDPEAQFAVRSALFNLYGSCREGSGLSVSPMGLTARGYEGHVFWDTEIWMYPAMLLLNQGIAGSMLQYRLDRVEGARNKARTYGYDGLMFPWESDYYGQEGTPPKWLMGPLQHHITADVAIAAWQQYLLTRDATRLKECWPLLKGSAEFWCSRVSPNADGSYSILGVVGADEFAQNVDDNAFTNGAAKVALRAAVKAAGVLGEPCPPQWNEVAEGIVIPVKDGITQDYAGYAGQETKQADPNLLAYPLGLVTAPERIRADLAYYTEHMDENGPAMTWGIFAVQYAWLGDREKAEEYFRRSYRPNLRPPFGVFAETAVSENPCFLTGCGALLQAVLYGFGGLDLTEEGLLQRESVLPEGWKKLTLKGIGPERRTYIVEGK